MLRANQKWAPYPDNDPDAARELMRRFYLLVARDSDDLRIDPKRASELEVEWWRLHRAHQHDPGVPGSELEQSLVDLYAYVYGAEPAAVRPAAAARVEAMDLSDAWVEAGCGPTTRCSPGNARRWSRPTRRYEPPSGSSRRIRSSSESNSPRPSRLLVVIQSVPSGAATTLRSRP